MNEEKITELLMDLKTGFSELKKDVEYIKTEMHSNYIRSDENDSATRELVEERTKWAANRQDSIKNELQGQIDLVKKENELQMKQIAEIEKKIREIDNKEGNRVLKRWEQIKDSVFKVGIGFIGSAVVYYFLFMVGKK